MGAQLYGSANPAWRGGPQPHACAECGQIVMRRASAVGQRVFCSPACYGVLRAPWRGGKIKLICAECGTEVLRYPSQVVGRIFCGLGCKNKYGLVAIRCAWPGCDAELSARVVSDKKGTLYKIDLTRRGQYLKHPICDHHRNRFKLFYQGKHGQQTFNSFWKIVRGEKVPRLGRGASQMLAFVVWERQDGRCATAGCERTFAFGARYRPGVRDEDAWALDHVRPVFEGGKTQLDNLQALCQGCHDLKSRGEKSRAALTRHSRATGLQRTTKHELRERIDGLAAEVQQLKQAVLCFFALAVAARRHG